MNKLREATQAILDDAQEIVFEGCRCYVVTLELIDDLNDVVYLDDADGTALKLVRKIANFNELNHDPYEIAEAFQRYLNLARKVVNKTGEWIPVETRLPEDEVHVDVLLDGKTHANGYLLSGYWHVTWCGPMPPVTHWRERPDPPKEAT